jgi:hypothetical protein
MKPNMEITGFTFTINRMKACKQYSPAPGQCSTRSRILTKTLPHKCDIIDIQTSMSNVANVYKYVQFIFKI